MKKSIFFLLLFVSTYLYSQEFTPEIFTLSENPQIEDFDFLKKELAGVQVVMLGENSHYDGNVFEMKTKIVQFLYKEMGFTTIAFESGIYDVWKAQQEIESGKDTKEAFMNSLFSIWSKTNEFQSFIEFYNQNKSNLSLFGFDYQITGTHNFGRLSEDIFEYAKKIKFNLKFSKDDFELLLESITSSGLFDEEDISYTQFKSSLTELKTKVDKQKDSQEKFYWSQIIKSLLELGNDAFQNKDILSSFTVSTSDNNRDKQMAENLLAYLKQHPEAKIICWGANVHFVNSMKSVQEPIVKDFVPMGSYVKRELNQKVYSLACVTANDSIFVQNKWYQTPIESTSFEDYLKKNKAPHIFISSDQKEMNKLMKNRFFSPIIFVEGNLSELHDGYLFFKNVTRATPIEIEIQSENSRRDDDSVKETEGSFSTYPVSNQSIQLDEVVIYGKRTPYSLMKQVIDSLNSNYLNSAFSSTMTTNVVMKIAGISILDFDFLANQYDLGYVNHTNRSSKSLQQIRWNITSDFQPESLREYHGLVYNSPIQYAPFLKKGKFKKFHFVLQETKTHNDEEVYVISFSSPREHSTFTRRVYLSYYSGYLYVNTKDLAIVKVIENWDVTQFPDSFREGYNFKNTLAKYTAKEYIQESNTTEFHKIGNHYFITASENIVYGEIYNQEGNREKFSIFVESFWDDFEVTNPQKIKNKDEEHSFNKIKYNPEFWKISNR